MTTDERPRTPRVNTGVRGAAVVTVIGGTLVVGGQPAAAATITVDSAADDGSGGLTLREAIDQANDSGGVPDVIVFDPSLAGSTITLGARLAVDDDLTIEGLGEAALTLTSPVGEILYVYNNASLSLSEITLDGAGDDVISANGVVAEGSGDVMLSAVTVTGASNHGVLFDSPGSDLTVIDSTIDANANEGVQVFDVATLTLEDSSFSNNLDYGVYFADISEDLTITASELSGNASMGLRGNDIGGDVVLTDATFADNEESAHYIADVAGSVTVTRLTATGNDGNGLYLAGIAGDVFVTDSVLSDNDDNGAEIENVGGNISITDTVANNNSNSGLYFNQGADGDLTIERLTAEGNGGDGLYVTEVEGAVVIRDTTVADSGEVGIRLEDNAGSVTVERTTVEGSADEAIASAPQFGPGPSPGSTGSVTVVNSTLSGNGAAVDAAVIDVVDAASLTVAHSTISGNGAPTATEAVVVVDGAPATVDHAILAGNEHPSAVAAAGTGSVVVTNSLTPVGSSLGASNVEADDPLLSALADNGGLTETLSPGSGSPAIDAGDAAIVSAPLTDQRGGDRQVGTIDIGAVEVSAGSVSVGDVSVDEDAGSASVVVTRSGGSDGAASVQVVSADGTAVAGSDFTAVDETVAWADGEDGEKTVDVAIIDDAAVEGDETFTVTLSDPSVASIDDGDAVVTIIDVEVAAVSPLDPSRFVDTRDGGDTFDDLFEGEGKRAAGSEYRVQIGGRGGVPAGAKAAVLNVTAVAPDGVGFVTVHPCVDPRPTASSLNFAADVNVANEIVAPLSDTGEVCIFLSSSAHVLVDVVGFVDADSPTVPVTPARYLDTRAGGATFDGDDQRGGRTTAGGQVTLSVADRGDVPANAVAVIANVAAVNPDGTGFVTVHPCEPEPPNASSLNYVAGVNRANELIASVGDDGEICLFTSTATDLLVDIVGFVPPGSSLNVVGPARFLDTRDSGETVDGVSEGEGKRGAGSELELQVAGRPGVPDGVSAVVANVTAVAPDGVGFVTVHPCVVPRPNASSLNFVAGVNGANELIAPLDADGNLCLYTSESTHLIVDVVAYLD